MKFHMHCGIALTAVLLTLTPSASILGAKESGTQAEAFVSKDNGSAGDVIVHAKFGGLIFGFEIDATGDEGLLCEAVPQSDGTIFAAVETFSQSTGKILHVLKR